MNNIDLLLKNEFENLPANFWDFKESTTRDLTHGLHYYPATMVYPISQNILKIVKKYVDIKTLMDPFMGSGTVLVEGMIANVPQIYGTDLNPLAVLMSKVKTTILSEKQLASIEEFKKKLKSIEEKSNQEADDFDKYIKNTLNLDITAKTGWGDNADKYINEYFNIKNKKFNYQSFSHLGFWFTPRVIILLQTIKKQIQQVTDVNTQNFLLLAFSETVRIVSNTRNGEFKLFRMNAEKVLTFMPNVFIEFYKILDRNVAKMQDFIKTCTQTKSKIVISLDDTRKLDAILDDSVDLVITSPPYGDSRTTVAYGQFSRLSLQWLDLDCTTQQEVSNIDKKLLGGKTYIHKEQWSFLQSPTLVSALTKIAEKDVFRAEDVFSFYVDLDKCLYSITKKMKKGGYQFWVVGNRTVKLEKLLTDKIIEEMSVKYGLKHLFSFNRKIINKVMPSENSPTNEAGVRVKTMTAEIVVVLKKEE